MERNILATLILFYDHLEFFPVKSDKALVLTFEPEIVSDKEVKKSDLLNDRIRIFVEQNKITPCSFVTLLKDELLLTKTFQTGTGETNSDEIKKFLDIVPFDNIRSKTYTVDKGFKVVAANQDYYEIIQASFERTGFRAEGTFPEDIYKKLGFVKQNSLSGQALFPSVDKKREEIIRRNKRAIVLGAVLLVLIIVMMAMFLVLDPLALRKKPVTKPMPAGPVVTDTATDFKIPVEEAQVATSSLRVKIQNASGISGAAGDSREIFKELGFVEINVGNATVQMQKSQLVYSNNINSALLESLVNKLQQIYPALVTQQAASAEADIVLTIGKDRKKLTP